MKRITEEKQGGLQIESNGKMKRKDKMKAGNAIYSELIFDRTVWLQKSKEREGKKK